MVNCIELRNLDNLIVQLVFNLFTLNILINKTVFLKQCQASNFVVNQEIIDYRNQSSPIFFFYVLKRQNFFHSCQLFLCLVYVLSTFAVIHARLGVKTCDMQTTVTTRVEDK